MTPSGFGGFSFAQALPPVQALLPFHDFRFQFSSLVSRRCKFSCPRSFDQKLRHLLCDFFLQCHRKSSMVCTFPPKNARARNSLHAETAG